MNGIRTVKICVFITFCVDHDISDSILYMMELASRIVDVDFKEDEVDGGVDCICVSSEEDMLVAMCYIASSITFNKAIDFETFNVSLER